MLWKLLGVDFGVLLLEGFGVLVDAGGLPDLPVCCRLLLVFWQISR